MKKNYTTPYAEMTAIESKDVIAWSVELDVLALEDSTKEQERHITWTW